MRLARLLRLIVLLELTVAAGLAAFAWQAGLAPLPSLALGLAAPLLWHGAIIALDFGLAWFAGSPTPAPWRLGVLAALGLFLREWRDSVLIFQFAQPWLAPRRLPGEAAEPNRGRPDALPVLLIHGYCCNRQMWRPMAAWLAARGHAIEAVDLEPVFGSIDASAAQIERALGRLLARTGAPRAALVGHSMGGLAARAFLRHHPDARVAALVTIGTPHRGTFHARFGQGENARQMRPDSPWLTRLAADEAGRSRPPITVILSHHDNIVAPQAGQTLPGAHTIETGGIGHLSLVREPRVWAWTAAALAHAAQAAGAAADNPRSECPASAAGTPPDRR